jgi:Na+-driven multidrug efflux pump
MAVSPPAARFVQGSTMRHVVVMASTGAVGLIAVFVVDLFNLFYIALLGERPLAAAIGFAGAIGFLQLSVAIGLMIGLGAVVSREIGAGELVEARDVAASGLLAMIAVLALVAAGTVAFVGPLLDLVGAVGEARAQAAQFVTIVAPSLPLAAAGMGCAALLRAVGDARRALDVTLYAALAAAVLDPLLIFGLHLGLEGAAISTVLSRVVLVFVGWDHAFRRRDLVGRLRAASVLAEVRRVLAVAGPAILTNLATPVGALYVTRSMAAFGPSAVAGQASIDRLTPCAFGLVYALSAAIGPILAQNLGAGRFDRVRTALRDALLFALLAVLGAWAILFLSQGPIGRVLTPGGEAAALVRLFCTFLAGSFLFTGALFVANAAFNNLGFPLLATLFNWGRATLGTIPLVSFGRGWGPEGVLIGQAAGSILFGTAAVIVAFRVIGRLGEPGTALGHGALAVSGASSHAAMAAVATRPSPQREPETVDASA